jgi:hypothetical protein
MHPIGRPKYSAASKASGACDWGTRHPILPLKVVVAVRPRYCTLDHVLLKRWVAHLLSVLRRRVGHYGPAQLARKRPATRAATSPSARGRILPTQSPSQGSLRHRLAQDQVGCN